jgi:hypothetical protein
MGSMSIDSSFEDLLSLFIARGVRFLVVGGYAFGSHTTARATKDLDLWIDATPANADKTWCALAEFGLPLGSIAAADLATPGPWLQFGVPPTRVDILTAIDGVEFADAWDQRVQRTFGRVPAPVIGIDDLIRNKKLVGRPRDLVDVKELERRRALDEGEGRVSEKAAAARRKRPRPKTVPRRRKAAARRTRS